MKEKILFAKLREDAIIPTKREEDGAFDIYANFDKDYMVINPHETVLIPTGLISAFSSDYVAIGKERGSTGTKGIGQRAGVYDSGYRGEWFVPLTNHNNTTIVIAKKECIEYGNMEVDDKTLGINIAKFKPAENIASAEVVRFGGDRLHRLDAVTIYPYEKAISQVIMVEVPKLSIEETTVEEVMSIKSERGTGALGSSGK